MTYSKQDRLSTFENFFIRVKDRDLLGARSRAIAAARVTMFTSFGFQQLHEFPDVAQGF